MGAFYIQAKSFRDMFVWLCVHCFESLVFFGRAYINLQVFNIHNESIVMEYMLYHMNREQLIVAEAIEFCHVCTKHISSRGEKKWPWKMFVCVCVCVCFDHVRFPRECGVSLINFLSTAFVIFTCASVLYPSENTEHDSFIHLLFLFAILFSPVHEILMRWLFNIRIWDQFAVANVLMKITDITANFIALKRYITKLITRLCTVDSARVHITHHKRTNERKKELMKKKCK